MRLPSIFAEFDRFDGYLLSVGLITSIVILAFQYTHGQLQLSLPAIPLLIVGFALLVYLRRRSDPTAFNLALLAAVFLILAYLSWPNRPDWIAWHDQSHYLAMTMRLPLAQSSTHSEVAAQDWWYPGRRDWARRRSSGCCTPAPHFAGTLSSK